MISADFRFELLATKHNSSNYTWLRYFFLKGVIVNHFNRNFFVILIVSFIFWDNITIILLHYTTITLQALIHKKGRMTS